MSTTLSIPRRTASRRNQTIATAAALVTAAAVAVAINVGGGSAEQASSQPVANPATAQPDPATLYRNESAVPSGPSRQAGVSAADRFHHFR